MLTHLKILCTHTTMKTKINLLTLNFKTKNLECENRTDILFIATCQNRHQTQQILLQILSPESGIPDEHC
jgi:hypothetical protein